MESWANDLLFLPEVLEVDILAALGSEDWCNAIHAEVVSAASLFPSSGLLCSLTALRAA